MIKVSTGVRMKNLISIFAIFTFLLSFADLAMARYHKHYRYHHYRGYDYGRHGVVRNTGHVAGQTVRGAGYVA
jgi:hypothetical protein